MSRMSVSTIALCASVGVLCVGLAGCKPDDRAAQSGEPASKSEAIVPPVHDHDHDHAEPTPPPPPERKPPIPHDPIAQDAKPLSKSTTPTGVIVEDFKLGTAGMPILPNAELKYHVIARLKDGWKTIQDSYAEGEPISRNFRDVLPGMADGIIGMKAGGVRRLTIPADRAKGSQEVRDDKGNVIIPANSTLVLDVEVIEFSQTLLKGERPQEPKRTVGVSPHPDTYTDPNVKPTNVPIVPPNMPGSAPQPAPAPAQPKPAQDVNK